MLKLTTIIIQREEKRKKCSLYKDHKLFLSEDRFEVIKVNYSIANISFFRINVPSSSKSIRFSTKISKTKPNDKVKLKEELVLSHLSLGQHLDSRKVLKVFIIYNNINRKSYTF